MSMLIELREAASLPKHVLELAIFTVSKLNERAHCVARLNDALGIKEEPEAVERLAAISVFGE